MAKSPFYKVLLKGSELDITEDITKFSHEDAVDADNLLSLEIRTADPEYLEKNQITEGNQLIFDYGYIGAEQSPRYLARIVDITAKYSTQLSIMLKATDLGILLKKNTSKRVWEDMRSSDIVREIGLQNGLEVLADETTVIHEFIPQAGRTDYKFLKYLASIEQQGSFRFFLKDNVINFTRRNLEKDSIRTFIYNDPNGEVISFTPSSKETQKDGSSRNTVVTSVDPFTNEVVQESVTNSDAQDDTKLGDFVIHFNENAEQVSRQRSEVIKNSNDQNRAGKHVNIPVTSQTEAGNIANKQKKDSALKDYTAELMVSGNPLYISDEIITMNNVSRKDQGNWYIVRANHSITPGAGYQTRLSLQKNAVRSSDNTDKTQQEIVNNTVGAEDGRPIKKKVKTQLYNENGELVGEEIQ